MTRLLRACSTFRSVRALSAVAILVASTIRPSSVDALSTVSARFEPGQIVADAQQPVRLMLTYFPGNGEAVTSTTLRFSPGVIVQSVHSTRGNAHWDDGQAVVDYLLQPVGASLTDTLDFVVETPSALSVQAKLSTTLDTAEQDRHRPTWQMPVAAPLELSWTLNPQVWYPGESLQVEVRVENTDSRSIEGLQIGWPADLGVEPDDPLPWPLMEGTGSYHRHLRIPADLPANLEIGAHAQGGQLTHSPLTSLRIVAGAIPQLLARVEEPLRRVAKGTVKLTWRLAGDHEMDSVDLMVAVSGLMAIESPDAEIDFDAGTGQAQIHVRDSALRAGQDHTVTVHLTPRQTGPLAFRPHFTPSDRSDPISDARVSIIPVIESDASATVATASPVVLTDLELARQGLGLAWKGALADLPVPSGSSIRLQAEGRHDANWMVEEAVTGALLERGDRLPLAADSSAYELRFRVATSHTTYQHRGSVWNPFSSSNERGASVSVHGRLLNPAGQVLWARRVESRGRDIVGSDAAARLGGAAAVEQSIVPASQRALEVGLSGLIVGGLFFVFFAP